MNVYTGRDRNAASDANQRERVVLELTAGLNGRNVTCDKFFTTYHLAEELKKRRMTVVGTIRKNRKELPSVLVDMKGKPQYHSEFVFDHALRATVVSHVPQKNHFVTLFSTYRTNKIVGTDEKRTPEISVSTITLKEAWMCCINW